MAKGMIRHLFDFKGLLTIVLLSAILQSQPAVGAGPQLLILGSGNSEKQKTKITENNATSSRTDNKAVETLVLKLSDEQVQRLIEAVAGRSQDATSAGDKEKVGGLAGLIEAIRFYAQTIQLRIHYLRSGIGDDPEDLPHLYRLLSRGESETKPNPLRTIMSVIALFVASHVILWIFRRFTTDVHRRIENHLFNGWKTKIGGLFLRALVRLVTMCVFVLVTLCLFFIFLERTGPQSVLVATYLAAFLIVMGVRLFSRFFLAPNVPKLRFLPLTTGTARYLYRWIMAIAAVGSFGWLTCGIFRVAGAGEGNHLMMVAMVNLMVIGMIITMILQKRHQVRTALSENLPDTGLSAWMARIWHFLAIFAALFLWLLSAANLFWVGIQPGAPGIQTLLIVPLYLLLDWALRAILKVVFGIAEKSGGVEEDLKVESDDSVSGADESAEKSVFPKDPETEDEGKPDGAIATPPERPNFKKHPNMQHFNRIIGRGLRIALAAAVFFYLLDIWGIDIQVGKAVTRTAFNILIAVLICYVTWEVINAAIQRRLKLEMPSDDDEDREEGGAGGSRIGTLLLLLRKFMLAVIIVMATMIILSSLGVNIGPLIAGAGVIGLAIGFGAQTLVKDIISGLFFLMDDAFRVGDYIQAAGTKGTVEHISLRSLRLRHPRGMVNTIPFGDIGIVQNMSRDYIITKLDFRVRYDTDVDKVRKIIKKKVYQEIMKDEELAPLLLDQIKSQGVRQMDDSAMIMRVKYKTPPGEQFKVRKEVYRLLQEAFREEGIEFAHRNVTVYIPPGEATGAPDKKAIEAGAAAALASEQAEAEKKQPKEK